MSSRATRTGRHRTSSATTSRRNFAASSFVRHPEVDDNCSQWHTALAAYSCSHPGTEELTTMSTRRPGEQELALLTWVAEHPAITVGEVADQYGAPRALARSTVLTMMERLRKKGHLSRKQVEGVFRYTTGAGPEDLLKDAVGTFVTRSLGGSVSPFV